MVEKEALRFMLDTARYTVYFAFLVVCQRDGRKRRRGFMLGVC